MQAGNRVRIEVAGSWYVISTTEESSYVEELARELDEQLTKLLGKNDSLSINDALILCSLQFLLDKRQSERSADRLRQQFSGYMEEIKRAKDDTAAKQKENEELRREVLQLRVELQQKQGGKQAEK
ncbi:MAG: cell division protein ZapA [Oscillospiraceae bacterium]|jgi:cell division protein ZapA|nr:cell division protein ZapA [Oscillospiraceae bacterium]